MSTWKQNDEFRKLLITQALSFPIMPCPQTEEDSATGREAQHCKYYNPQHSPNDGCLIHPECIWEEEEKICDNCRGDEV